MGRFLTQDPFPGLPSQPQTLNPYPYVLNNPINLTDPSGEFALIPLLLVGAVGGALGGLGYYAIKTVANPCIDWDWEKAVFWTGAGTVIGAAISGGIYGGWWIGAQAGWWGTATVTTAGATANSPAGQRIVLWLEQNVNRVQRIMAPKHAWDRLVNLSGNLHRDYQAIQPYVQQAINSGTSTQINMTSKGPLMQFVATINGQQVVVRAIQLSGNVYQISDAWVQTR